MRIWLAMFVAICFVKPLAAAPDPKELVKAEVLSSVSSVKPGDSFQVGVLLKIKPEWHIYWTNPGDSGLATKVDFKVSDGKVGEVQFPTPVMFKQPGDIIGYGYKDEVMLLTTVEVPKEAKIGSDLRISADAAWLCCHDICLPGNDKLEQTVHIADKTMRQNEKVFERWQNELPRPSNQSEAVANILQTIDQSTAPTKASGKLTMDVTWKKVPDEIELYPPGTPTSTFEVVSVQTQRNTTVIVISFKAEARGEAEKRYPQAVLAYTIDSKRHGVVVPLEIDRPLLPASATRPTANAAEK